MIQISGVADAYDSHRRKKPAAEGIGLHKRTCGTCIAILRLGLL